MDNHSHDNHKVALQAFLEQFSQHLSIGAQNLYNAHLAAEAILPKIHHKLLSGAVIEGGDELEKYQDIAWIHEISLSLCTYFENVTILIEEIQTKLSENQS